VAAVEKTMWTPETLSPDQLKPMTIPGHHMLEKYEPNNDVGNIVNTILFCSH
jgi:hypothetical protein